MTSQEQALWLWLETLSHRQEDRLCCVCGSMLTGESSARCWRCEGKGIPAESKPIWVAVMFCCPTCGQPAELGAGGCVCCGQPFAWVVPVRSVARAAGLDGGELGDLLDELRAGRVGGSRPAARSAPAGFLAGEDAKLVD